MIKQLLTSPRNPFYRMYYLKKYGDKADKDLFNRIKEYSFKHWGKVTFLQIGGNDGELGDPVYHFVKHHQWKGVILEPQRKVFENKLKKTYRSNDRVELVNAAIAEKSDKKTIYKISFSDSRWATGLASLNREKIENNIKSGYVERRAKEEGEQLPANKEDWITEEVVQTYSVNDIIRKFNVSDLNVLVMDTEGYDYTILNTLDFTRIKPDVLIFEYGFFTPEQEQKINERLKNNNYAAKKLYMNTFAIQKHKIY